MIHRPASASPAAEPAENDKRLFFGRTADGYRFNSGEPLMNLFPPAVEVNGRESVFTAVSADPSRGTAEYRCGGLTARDRIHSEGDGLFSIERTVVNAGNSTRTFKLIFECATCFTPAKTTIPVVSYDGNPLSSGNLPRGTEHNGEAWIFAYDRTPIPSCTISETPELVAAVFASDRDEASLRSSCSFPENSDGTRRHRIFYPVTEAPMTYWDHDVMTDRYDEYLTLAPGERFVVLAYVFLGAPKWKNYGSATLLDRLHTVFPFRHGVSISPEEAYETAIEHSRFLVCDFHGVKMFRNIMRDNPDNDSIYFPTPVFEAGWSGQCFQQSRMFIADHIRRGSPELLETALSCLDAWMETQFPSGLFQINYARSVSGNHVPGDVCNFGWAAAEAVKAYRLLKSIGIDRKRYLDFAVRLCDFFVGHYDPRDGFGARWTMEGERVDRGHSAIGGFMIMALLELHRETGEEKYLRTARQAHRLYQERDIDNFAVTGGAIDCDGVDKEGVYPYILCSLDLFELTGEKEYLEAAEKAAYYFFSWTFLYDVLYPAGSDFTRYGYYTSGGTAVSVKHPAIDLWGIIVVPEYIRLWKHTGDERWKERAVMLWRNATLCITPKGGAVVLGHKRPYGLQSEAFFQCRWTRYRNHCEERGHINDMYVGWPAAYRLSALERLTGVCGESWDLLR